MPGRWYFPAWPSPPAAGGAGAHPSVPMLEMLTCEGNIEDWLQQLCQDMQRTVRFIMREAVTEAATISSNLAMLGKFFYAYPSQVVVTVLQIIWTTDVSKALMTATGGKHAAERKETSKRLLGIKELLADHIRLLDMSPAHRTHIQTLITMAVHNHEVWETSLKKSVKDVASFEWQKQLRFYWTDRDRCVLRIADSDVSYSDEYLGIKERLVITPLTDRCYITLSQALSMYMGGAPAGPAGTGKTETVKDLGRAAGKYVVVFNCSDQWDFRSLGKIFRGLAQSGSWGCFDEFNRISLPVLSVVSHQVHTLFHAMRQHRTEFNWIDGGHCRLNPSVGIFITMNPGYAGRQELPENLKALFRGISMMAPERQVIMKVKLAAAGYKQDERLSKKFNILYIQCEQQLSNQRHYDFGLRSILSVLRSAGDVLRKASSSSAVAAGSAKMDEEAIFRRTVRDMNLSKLVFDDVPVFRTLLEDLFPNRPTDTATYPELEGALRTHAQESHITATPEWILKCVQIYETKLVRHGLMVIGPAGSGKTTCYQALLRALHEIEGKHKEVRMNPKAITSQQMFGTMDPLSGDWTDGVFSFLWRRHNREKHAKVWIICDGPVDTLWIESLNTVLDDNKLLTLANGDRILMAPTLKMCFEAEDLRNASPATVSRAGIIFLSLEDVGWQPVFTAKVEYYVGERLWAATTGQAFTDLGLQHLEPLYRIVVKECTPPALLTLQHIATNTIRIAHSLSQEVTKLPHAQQTRETGEMVFWFAAAWALGGPLDLQDRIKISIAIRQLMPAESASGDIFKQRVLLGGGQGGVRAKWAPWADSVPAWTPSHGMAAATSIGLSNIFVPTADSTVLHHLFQAHHEQHLPCLVLGSAGSAKTVTIEQFLIQSSAQGDNYAWKKANISQATTPQLFQSVIEDLCEKRMGATYGPKRNKQLSLFIDDLNMAHTNEWGDQETCELMRQIIEFNGMYSLQKIGEWKRLVDMFFFSALTVSAVRSNTSGAPPAIPNRLRRHFTVLNAAIPPQETLELIFGSILEARLHGSQLTVAVPSILQATLRLWTLCQQTLLPTPSRFYYSFNLTDLSRLTQGLLLCPVKSLTTTSDLVGLWYSEITQVLCNKLNHWQDVEWFKEQLHLATKDVWGANQATDLQFKSQLSNSGATVFTTFAGEPEMDPETGEEKPLERVYSQTTVDIVTTKLNELLLKHNESRKAKKLSLVLFESAVEHVLRIVRVLATPQGSMLLVGLGGSGKQSLTRLAAFAQGYPVFQPTINAHYNTQNWFEDLQGQYLTAGVVGPTVFLVTDAELKQENFLEYINSILASGEVPGLFTADDRESALGSVRSVAKSAKPREFEDSEEWLWTFFINRVRENLHFVICFTPERHKFQSRVRRFPAIVGGCQLNFYFPWPVEAMLDVSRRTVDANEPLIATAGTAAERLPAAAADIHNAVRQLCEDYFTSYRYNVGTTPKLFLSFVDLFHSLYCRKLSFYSKTGDSLLLGLRKLHEAREDVDRLRIDLKDKEATLQLATRETDLLLKEITVATDAAEVTRKDIATVTESLATEQARIASERAVAEEDLEKARPALIAAKEALDQISQNDMKWLKSLQNPPVMIRRIFDGVNILLHEGVDPVKVVLDPSSGRQQIQDSWVNFGRAMCSNVDLFDRLQEYCGKGKDTLNDETCELLRPYLDQEDFTQERARSAAGNVAGLCTWTRAMVTYHEISKYIAPKIQALDAAEKELRVANKKLSEKQEELQRAEDEVAHHMEKLNAAKAKKDELEADALTTRRKVEYATELIAALPEERQRWEASHNSLSEKIRKLIGDSLAAAAFITYGAPFNGKYREKLLTELIFPCLSANNLPFSRREDGVTLRTFLVEEETVALWQLQSLPMDEQSVDNAVMMTTTLGMRVPLLVDPQEQGSRWLINYLEEQLEAEAEAADAALNAIKGAAKKKDAKKKGATAKSSPTAAEPEVNQQQQQQQQEGEGGEDGAAPATAPASPVDVAVDSKQKEGSPGADGLHIDTAFAAGADEEEDETAFAASPTFGIAPSMPGHVDDTATKAPVKQLAITSRKDKDFMKVLEQQLAQGGPLIIEDVSGSDPLLDSLLEQRVTRAGKRQVMWIQGEQYDYDESFSLYLTTKLSNFQFETEFYAKVAVLNFSVTINGLHEQLLARVIQSERQELEHHKSELMREIQANQQRLSGIEQELLAKLSSVEGSLVDDESLMATLSNSKASYVEVKRSLETAGETRERIDAARAEYAAVALRGAVLYFVAVDIAQVNHCYQLSLARFIHLFDLGLMQSAPSSQTSQRIKSIIDRVSELFFVYVGRGLFEVHKSLLILLMAGQVDIHNGKVPPEAFNVFLRGGTMMELDDLHRNHPRPFQWLVHEAWHNVVALQQNVSKFRHLTEYIKRDEPFYRGLVDSDQPETVHIEDYKDATPFERLLLLRALRPDKVPVAAALYAQDVLGPYFREVPPVDMESIVDEVQSRDPILFLLSAGSDPTSQLEGLAKRKKKGLHQLSLGQGQEAAAMALLEQCCGTGDWVVFQNCHLGIQFLNNLEGWVLQQQAAAASSGKPAGGVRPDLRVWLTSSPTDEFPIALLHKCLKITNEPPSGMAASMAKACSWLTQDVYEMFRRSEWRPALYSLCYLHAVLLERRQYGPQGWSTPYQFSDGDWHASMLFLQNHFAAVGDNERRSGPIPWDGVRFMVGDIQYGGRVTSLRDRITLQTVVEKVFHPRINEVGMLLCPELKKFPIPEPNADLTTLRHRVATAFTAHEPPQVVGLHGNAELAQKTRQTNELLGTILTIQPKTVTSVGGMSRDETVAAVAEQALKRLPKPLKPSKIKEECKKLGKVRPLSIFFGLEANRLSELIRYAERTLTNVVLATAGTITLTPELEAVCDSLFAGAVPAAFLSRSWPDATFSGWLSNVDYRFEQVTDFLAQGWLRLYSLAHFFNPKGFLSSIRQEACRRHQDEGWALDRVENKFDVTKWEAADAPDNAPDEGAYLCNLSLEGASWDRHRHRLRQPAPKELFHDLPVVHVHSVLAGASKAPQQGTEGWAPAPPAAGGDGHAGKYHRPGIGSRDDAGKRVRLPCYVNPKRGDENIVCEMDLQSDEDPTVWILRGAVVLCNKV